jgi:hypothetical protein
MIKKHTNLTPKERALYDATYDAIVEEQVVKYERPYLVQSLKLLLDRLHTHKIKVECYSYVHDRLIRDFSVTGSLRQKYNRR